MMKNYLYQFNGRICFIVFSMSTKELTSVVYYCSLVIGQVSIYHSFYYE